LASEWNKKIDEFIKEMHLKIKYYKDIIFGGYHTISLVILMELAKVI